MIRAAVLPSHWGGGDLAFFSLPCHQSRQRGRKLARVGSNEFIHPNRDGLWSLGVVAQGLEVKRRQQLT